MGKMKLGLDTLNQIDMGKIKAAFDHELKHVVKDALDRPGDSTPRVVQLSMSVVPDVDSQGVAETVTCEFNVKSKVPPRRSKKYQLQASANGTVMVNPESPDNIHQGTLDEIDRD